VGRNKTKVGRNKTKVGYKIKQKWGEIKQIKKLVFIKCFIYNYTKKAFKWLN